MILHFRGGDLFVNKAVLLRQLMHTALYGHVEHSHPKQCAYSKARTLHLVKQHTVNPLIAHHVNPFLLCAISTVSVLFFSTDHCIGVTGDVNDTMSVPSSVRMPTAVPL
ncbi:unnamed protein product [Staurois parvus]|uniref:Uncharacterized protein n=1 Tax=Staurois parvus TaxID=386267 RepID=A0ABN9CQ65_9NEOB|nr:unnamed protein product [Staurois parvus]